MKLTKEIIKAAIKVNRFCAWHENCKNCGFELEKDDDEYSIAECPIVAKTKKEAIEGGHILSFINKVLSSSEILHEHEKRWKITKGLIDAAININKICKKYDNCADCILSCGREEALRCMVIGKSWTTLNKNYKTLKMLKVVTQT